ncbi:PqqD family protein [Streptomyces sp. ME19-01-6]|uniref:PqqD family protein n=1 Tax=Streptomyces sp. ME19-01-6 TaxID=3028686 RepID=UPI0029AF4F06|nr:PqqD family protein [Streptomyces sp. ME19-01-6]MDX3232154.1 PqqD family protein [Streptomyces sp. ME19-01-6]
MLYRIAPDVVWMADDGEVRLYDAGSGEFQTLNSTGAELWLLVSEGQPVNAIASQMAQRYAAEDTGAAAVVVRDVREFLDSLAGQGLLLADDVAPPRTAGPSA